MKPTSDEYKYLVKEFAGVYYHAPYPNNEDVYQNPETKKYLYYWVWDDPEYPDDVDRKWLTSDNADGPNPEADMYGAYDYFMTACIKPHEKYFDHKHNDED